MPHVIILEDEFGNPIGEYYPPHDDEGGRAVPARVVWYDNAAQSVQRAIGDKHVDVITVKFKAK